MCVFPFLVSGKPYCDCVNGTWCATKIDADYHYISWDYCDKKGIKELGKLNFVIVFLARVNLFSTQVALHFYYGLFYSHNNQRKGYRNITDNIKKICC